MSDAGRIEASDNTVLLQTSAVRKKYPGAEAVHDITMQLRTGEIVGLVGPNGAGKTTLLSLMAGVIYPSRGHVTVFGKHRWRESFEIRKNSFYLPALFPTAQSTCPFEYLRFISRVYMMKREAFREKLTQLASEMRLLEQLIVPWEQLSLGMQKKAGLIAAFLVPVKLRILDEPFAGGIDPFAMEILFSWMDEARLRQETTIFSTQVLDQAETVCDRIAMMDEGRLVAFDTPQTLIRNAGLDPSAPRAFVQAFFRLTGKSLKP